ncbi:MAG: Kae1-associated serine/threonine protein kinase [bacterium]|nr:Kae1-associated serine/threonine protein kinase [bacterium]
MKLLAEGAEAKIYRTKNTVVKDRIKKSYRIKEIDDRLRKFRTRREAKVFDKLEQLSFPAPRLIDSSDRTMEIEMDYINGKKVRDVLTAKNCKKLGAEIGKDIGILHKNHIIHGDLTTSNMILKNKVYFIDFGLSFFSKKAEDKAVDLHLLRQTLESKHHKIWKTCFAAVLQGYKRANKDNKEILQRFEKVEARGRNKIKN